MYVVTRLVEMQNEKSNNVSLLSVDGGEVGKQKKRKEKGRRTATRQTPTKWSIGGEDYRTVAPDLGLAYAFFGAVTQTWGLLGLGCCSFL